MAEFNYLYRQFVLRTLRVLYQGYARLTGRKFRCKTLTGEAILGCYVNSDMTVSCNCQDVDGTGQLGNLRLSAFEEIFTGEKTMRLRRQLARGRLPLNRCAACFSLEITRGETAENDLSGFRLPRGVCVENTILCNLRCLSCCRQMVMKTRGQRHCLSLDDVDVIARTLQRLGATFCGFYNLGEPFYSPRIRGELEILRKYNPQMEIFISTNGILIDNDDKMAAALLTDHIIFSIDGVSTEMVQRYQRGGNFEKAYKNLKALVSLRDSMGREKPIIGWKYVVFRWNDKPDYIRALIKLAEAAGIDYIEITFARTPWHGFSWRFFSPFYRSLAKREGRSRIIWLRKPGSDSIADSIESAKHDADQNRSEFGLTAGLAEERAEAAPR